MSRFWGSGKFPYTTTNNLNLDWMIKLVLELKALVESLVIDVGEAYVKPESGIPKTDLSAGVQASLDKADSALQSVPDTYRTAAAQDVIDGVQDAKITPLYNAQELSGASIQFVSESDLPLAQFIIDVLPIQSGSGAPSPTNQRPITSRSSVVINHNSTATEITLPAASYGGELDVQNGMYTDDTRMIALGDITTWGFYESGRVFRAGFPDRRYSSREDFGFCSGYSFIGSGSLSAIVSRLHDGEYGYQSSLSNVLVRDDRFIDDTAYPTNADKIAAFIAANANTVFVYPVRTPTTNRITADRITAVIGSNTFSTTAGTIRAIVNGYLSNLQQQLDAAARAAMIAPVEGSTVSRAYAVNDFLIYNNQLCKVTAPIQSGGTIQIGVNAVITTLGAEITALLNS